MATPKNAKAPTDPATVAPEAAAPVTAPSQPTPPSQQSSAPTVAPLSDQEIAEQRLPPPVPDQVDSGGDYQPQNESEQMLLGPTGRPQEPISAGMHAGRIEPPPSAKHWLPVVMEAAKDPNAPPQLVLLARLMSYHMGL